MQDQVFSSDRAREPSARDLEELRRILLASVRRACPPALADSAEDIVQTAMIQVLSRLRAGGGIEVLGSSYLKRVACNATVDEIRRAFRRRESQPDEASTMDDMEGNEATPHGRFTALEIDNALRDCLSRLAGPRRIAVALQLQGYSMPEAARLAGWTPKKTEHLAGRGMKDLRACMEGRGITP